ncbi:MAG TPA: LegC family aminotransferase [Methylibium sp.]|nr:LegC family aminotransferase [Methylibium sp.]
MAAAAPAPNLAADRQALVEAVLAATRRAIGDRAGAVALHEPEFAGREREYVQDCLDTGWVSSIGAYVERFERALADYTGAGHVAATVNGTAALHLCLKLAGVQPGDEVLTPALSFVATANAVSHCGATPHFVDSEFTSLGVDAGALEAHLRRIAERRGDACVNRGSGATIRALVVMHSFGHPGDLDALAELAARWGLVLVEDAAESLGSFYKGRHTGRHGRLAALSFNGNKIITTGGGGAVLTDDPELGRRARHLSTTARVPDRWNFVHDEVAWNYRMPNLNAALGCAQMEVLPRYVEEKRRLAARYREAIAGVPGLRFVDEPPHTRSNFWLVAVLLPEADAALRDALLERLNAEGLMSRPVWRLMQHLPMYANAPRAPLPVAESIEARLVNLPSSPRLARAG